MASHRVDRLAQDIKWQLSDLIRTLKDPRITSMLSVVRVELTNDLSQCKVYISSLDGIEQAKTAVKALSGAAGFIRREISMRVDMRRTPQFLFIADNSIEYSADIAKKLDDLLGESPREESQ